MVVCVSQSFVFIFTVLKDLKILETQQRESEQQLNVARQTKDRRILAQVGLEATLEKLKYQNGQERALLQKWHDKLAQGNRSLSLTRDGADSARRELERVELQLKRTLETKRAVATEKRRCERLLAEIQTKAGMVHRLQRQADEKLSLAHSKRLKIKDDEADLYEALRSEAEREKSIHQEIVLVRLEISTLEQEIGGARSTEAKQLENINHLKQIHIAEHERLQNWLQEMCKQISEANDRKHAKQIKLQEATRQAAESKNSYHQSWVRIISIQDSEGHKPSLPPSETSDQPILDIESIRESVCTVTRAVLDESASKNDVANELSTVRIDVAKHESDLEKTQKLAAKLAESNQAVQAVQNDRKATFEMLFSALKNAKSECDMYSANIPKLQKKRDGDLDLVGGRLKQTVAEVDNLNVSYSKLKQQMDDVHKDIEAKERKLRALLLIQGLSMGDVKAKVALTTEACTGLKSLAGEADQSPELGNANENDRHDKGVDQTNADIAKLLKSKCTPDASCICPGNSPHDCNSPICLVRISRSRNYKL